ncbi:uncharacterized protein LOC110976766 [Acanthaster planci]|uniref:Uncharacterized protein LOC110976766 n=1 Tax=Acanthaster planci TaxID=133434 RepID=A0A8B7XYP1_ACAPL|nr:uncharacterized protein LOC110976766 [Acanthaster planci]
MMGCARWSALKKTSKKELFVYVSIFLALFLVATIINDIVAYTVTEKTHLSTQTLSESVLVMHIISFYLALLGFVYITQAGKNWKIARCEWFSLVLNFLACFVRIAIEASFIRFREEGYRNFTE